MKTDRRILYISAYAVSALLLLSLSVSTRYNEILCAALMCVMAVLISVIIKKRAIYAYTKRQITALMCFNGFFYVSLYLFSGLFFGFGRPLHSFSLDTLWRYILPIAVTIVSSEVLRTIMLAQNSRHIDILSYIICVLSELLLSSTIADIQSSYVLVDVVAQTLFPAIIANLLYTYLSRRYGAMPNIGYRLMISLFAYIIPIASNMPASLYAVLKLIIPILIYYFIDATYEKKKRNALAKKSFLGYVLSGVAMVIVVLFVMLISCRFRYGLLVIGSPSMTGEIHKGDAIIYEAYDDRKIEVGHILVFEKNGSTIVHRVVEVDIIDGQSRFITKGDANEEEDMGYILKSDITGIVQAKIPAVGWPTLWLRDLFK